MKYFAYGSNMDKDRMASRNINFTSRQFAILEGYNLLFNKKSKEGVAANIEKSDTDFIEGILYEFPDEEILILDKYEGYPREYNRIKITVKDINENLIEVVIYIAQPDKIVNGLHPTKEYINFLLAGKDILSPQYIDKIKKIKTAN